MRPKIPPFLATLLAAALLPAPSPAVAASDPEAVALARSVIERMGGQDAWDSTRFLKWRFLGRRLHHWDKWTGDVRIESGDTLVLMNLGTRAGRVWKDGAEVKGAAELAEALELGYAWWVNDAYWLAMPYKLLDPGVILSAGGEAALPDGRPADVLVVTFEDGTGLTPRNRYDLFVARDSGLVEQWSYRADRDDPEPRFTGPWAEWKRFGRILLATERGRDADWEIAAPDTLDPALFREP